MSMSTMNGEPARRGTPERARARGALHLTAILSTFFRGQDRPGEQHRCKALWGREKHRRDGGDLCPFPGGFGSPFCDRRSLEIVMMETDILFWIHILLCNNENLRNILLKNAGYA